MKQKKFQSKSTLKIMSASFIIGFSYWIFDSVIDFIFSDDQLSFLLQHGPTNFWDAFIKSITPYDLIQRLIIWIIIEMNNQYSFLQPLLRNIPIFMGNT